MKIQRSAIALFVCLVSMLSARAGTITVGLPAIVNNGNCIPFGCADTPFFGTFTEYQQVYASSAFPSAVAISQISFFDTEDGPGSIDSATYTFALSTTSKGVSGLSPILSDNIGPDEAQFFSGVLNGPITGGMFTITGTPFIYNPANGNLLLDILISNPAPLTNSSVFLDQSDGAAGTTDRAYASTSGNSADNPGLITAFTTSSVPEPSPEILVAAGIAMCAFLRRAGKQ